MALSNSTPVAYAQQFIISFHEFTGTPWWATIMLSAVTLRLVITLPLTVYQVGKISLVKSYSLNLIDLFTHKVKYNITGNIISFFNEDCMKNVEKCNRYLNLSDDIFSLAFLSLIFHYYYQ